MRCVCTAAQLLILFAGHFVFEFCEPTIATLHVRCFPVHIDISRVFNNVLPQQTQPTDSFSGEKTITSNYTQWYLEVLLRRVSAGHIVYSPNHKAFVSLHTEGQLPFCAEEYADLMGTRQHNLWGRREGGGSQLFSCTRARLAREKLFISFFGLVCVVS